MKRTGRFAPNESERKQLEEISHLYFSSPASPPPEDVQDPREKVPAKTPGRDARSFFVYCTAGGNRSFLASRFLYNLSLLLRIADEPVLLLCSGDAFRNRFSFSFRPDRDRAVAFGGNRSPTGFLGPLGVCLLDSRSTNKACVNGSGIQTAQGLNGTGLFHYVLSDKSCPEIFSAVHPDITLFLVTPETPKDAFSEALGKGGAEQEEHAGIVTEGVHGPQEALRLYSRWKTILERTYPDRYCLESFGMFPDRGGGDSPPVLSAMGVLENPTSRQTRSYLETASLIRKKRMEKGKGSFSDAGERYAPAGIEGPRGKENPLQERFSTRPVLLSRSREGAGVSKEALFQVILKSPFLRAAGFESVSHEPFGRDPRYPQFLLRDSTGRLNLLEFVLKGDEQEQDSLLSRYTFLRNHLPWIVEFLKAGSSCPAGINTLLPGVVLISDAPPDSKNRNPGLPPDVPVESYRLRYEEGAEGVEAVLEP